MRKYFIIGSVVAFVLIAVSVFALQAKSGKVAVAQEVQPLAASASGSGCGAGGSGCGAAGSVGCGGAAGGCGGEAVDPAEARIRQDKIIAYLQDYYTTRLGYQSVEVKIDDFGCHQEAVVSSAGKVIDKLSVSGNTITKIEG
ncbi:MAG: hypothetical protein JSV70_07725 [bacterium]|nr:MAG: hypothetical protein JSV70_07725 [bacterium]